MQKEYEIDFRRSIGNLHIALSGEFSGMCAWELIKTINKQPRGAGRVFVNTKGLCKLAPAGTALFKSHMAQRSIPKDWLYLKGEKGFEMAPEGCRVLVCKKNENRKRKGPRLLKTQPRKPSNQ